MPRTTRLALVVVLLLMPTEAVAPRPELVAGTGRAAGPVSLLVEGRRYRLADIEDGGWTLEACPALSLLTWERRIECRTVGRRVDGEDEAVCTADGVDLAQRCWRAGWPAPAPQPIPSIAASRARPGRSAMASGTTRRTGRPGEDEVPRMRFPSAMAPEDAGGRRASPLLLKGENQDGSATTDALSGWVDLRYGGSSLCHRLEGDPP